MKRQVVSEGEVWERLRNFPGVEEGRKERETIFQLGEKLRDLRTSHLGISQKDAAKLIGIEQPELSRIETGMGKREPSFLTISRIISAYETYLQQSDPTIHVELSISISSDKHDDVALIHLTGAHLSS